MRRAANDYSYSSTILLLGWMQHAHLPSWLVKLYIQPWHGSMIPYSHPIIPHVTLSNNIYPLGGFIFSWERFTKILQPIKNAIIHPWESSAKRSLWRHSWLLSYGLYCCASSGLCETPLFTHQTDMPPLTGYHYSYRRGSVRFIQQPTRPNSTLTTKTYCLMQFCSLNLKT